MSNLALSRKEDLNKESSKNSLSLKDFKKDCFKNPDINKAYNDLDPEYEIIRAIVKARIENILSQKELAERIGTKQAHISRLESGEYNPSLKFLKKVAKGLGKELTNSFE